MAKVVVVGAGFCGLSAALALTQAGVDVVVVEARDRVGGRVEVQTNGLGELVDTGGQFICEDMPEVMALAGHYGKTLVETDFSGDYVTQPGMPYVQAERVVAESTELRARLNAVSPDDPSLEGHTVADWLERQNVPADVQAAFRAMIEGLWCVSIESLPAWYLVDNDRRITNEVGELQYSLGQTMHSLADDLARELGARVRLATSVTKIERGATGVRVTTDGGEIEADSVLVAVPPATAARIDYVPVLPESLTDSLDAWRSGTVIKVLVRYATPFWRDRGLSGMVMWRQPSGLFAFDASPNSGYPMLAFFIGGPLAVEWGRLGEEAVRSQATARLVAALGAEAGDMLDMTIRDWTNDRWSGGAYSDVVIDMDARNAEDVLRSGAPPLFFASSELSPSFPGYVEGAIVAGRHAAAKIVTALDNRNG